MPPDAYTKVFLAPHQHFTAASSSFPSPRPDTLIYPAASKILLGNDTITLSDAASVAVDSVSWATSRNTLQREEASPGTLVDTDVTENDFIANGALVIPPAGGLFEETTLPPDVCSNLDGYQASVPAGYILDGSGACQPDACLNLPGLQPTMPAGYESLDGINCTLIPPPAESATILITELLPNAASTDTGKEFIELYNPNARAVNLKNYKLELGPGYTKNYLLPDQALGSGAYASFSDTQTGIVLPNTNATLRLSAPAGNVVDETGAYDTPVDDMAWALTNNAWQYTNQPTPGAANLPNLEDSNGATGGSGAGTSALEPCPAGKFRNPETNRCKNIEDGAGSLAPCAADQVRNPDTNRCRSIFSATGNLTPCQPGQTRNPDTNRCRAGATAASASLTPCGAGQERNPATNRCRKIGSTAGNLKPCAANQERNPTTNRCRKKLSQTAAGKIKDDEAQQVASTSGWMIVGGTVAAAAGYGIWEWRTEMANWFRRARGLFGKSLTDD